MNGFIHNSLTHGQNIDKSCNERFQIKCNNFQPFSIFLGQMMSFFPFFLKTKDEGRGH